MNWGILDKQRKMCHVHRQWNVIKFWLPTSVCWSSSGVSIIKFLFRIRTRGIASENVWLSILFSPTVRRRLIKKELVVGLMYKI